LIGEEKLLAILDCVRTEVKRYGEVVAYTLAHGVCSHHKVAFGRGSTWFTANQIKPLAAGVVTESLGQANRRPPHRGRDDCLDFKSDEVAGYRVGAAPIPPSRAIPLFVRRDLRA